MEHGCSSMNKNGAKVNFDLKIANPNQSMMNIYLQKIHK